jgi:2-(1,2-epoxy-1,2-dihydrophenyl)acetyl-CoA isomerase
MEFVNIVFQQQQGIATITINSPQNLNAITANVAEEMLAALTVCESEESVRVVVITGAGRAFSSGGDIAAMKQALAQDSAAIMLGPGVRKVSQLALAIRNLGKPVIAAVNGVAAGAGANLALVCDFRIAAEQAQFIEAFVTIGLVPDMGGVYLLTKAVGYAKATELVMTGVPLTAQAALSLGLVNQVVPADALPEAVGKLARKLAALPALSLARIKALINRAAFDRFEIDLNNEYEYQLASAAEADFSEGINAFLEKRQPVFNVKQR